MGAGGRIDVGDVVVAASSAKPNRFAPRRDERVRRFVDG